MNKQINKRSRWYGLLFMVLVLLLSGCVIRQNDLTGSIEQEKNKGTQQEAGQKTEAQQKTEEQSSEAQTPAESAAKSVVFDGRDVEGNTITSAIFSEAELTMVNVWATYCNPCLKEMPGLGELAGEYEKGELQILGIISDVREGDAQENVDYAAELIEQTGAAYPHMLLNSSVYMGLLTEVVAVPTTFFFNAKGELLDTVVGSMDKEDWKEKIDAFLEK